MAADALPDEGFGHLVLDPGPTLDLFVLLHLGARQRDVSRLLAQAARLHQAAGLQAPEDLVDVLRDLENGGVRTERTLFESFNASLKQKEHVPSILSIQKQGINILRQVESWSLTRSLDRLHHFSCFQTR